MTLFGRRVDPSSRALEHAARCGRGSEAARRRSSPPACEQPGEQHRGLHLRRRDRELVVDRARARRPRRRAARGRRSSRSARPCAGAARRRAPSDASRATRRRRARSARSGPRGCPASEPHERPRVPRSRAARRARARPRRPTPWTEQRVDVLVDDLDAERAHRRDRRLGVRGATEAGDADVALAERADEHRAVRDRLVARHRDVPLERGHGLDAHRASLDVRVARDPPAAVQGESGDADLLRDPAVGREDLGNYAAASASTRPTQEQGDGVLLHRRPALDHGRVRARGAPRGDARPAARCSSRPESTRSGRRSSRRATSRRTRRRLGCWRP